jgi:hypothetical protein
MHNVLLAIEVAGEMREPVINLLLCIVHPCAAIAKNKQKRNETQQAIMVSCDVEYHSSKERFKGVKAVKVVKIVTGGARNEAWIRNLR